MTTPSFNFIGGNLGVGSNAPATPPYYSQPQQSVLGANATNMSKAPPVSKPAPKPAPKATTTKTTTTNQDVGSNMPQVNTPQVDPMDNTDINSLIDQQKNEQLGYLNDVENQLRSQLPIYQQQAQDQYNTGKSQLDQQLAQSQTSFNEQGVQAGQRKEDALSAARRLYNELRQGYQQRFGGASSAGDAASTLASVEQQRQQGGVQRDYGTTMRQIQSQQQDIEYKHKTALLQLEQQKNSDIAQANRDFQQKLLDLSKARADVSGNAAQARLSALQDLRNKVFAINSQAQQFQQQLELQRQQQGAALSRLASQAEQARQLSAGWLDQFNSMYGNAPTSNLRVGSNMPQTQQMQQIQGAVKAYPVQTLADGRTRYSDGSIR